MFAQTETSLSSVFPARIKNLIVAINTVAFKPPVSFGCREGGYTNALIGRELMGDWQVVNFKY